MERDIPGSPPPNAHESIAGSLIAYSVACFLVVVAVVSLRLYIRLRVIRKFGSDDIALGVTTFSTVVNIIGITSATRFGLGAHIDILSEEERSRFLILVFVSSIGYHVCIMLLKYTFLLQYRRVFPLPKFQRLCDIFLAFLSVWAVAGLVGAVTVCLPISKNWDLREPIWACTQRFWFWLGYGIVHVITDVLILIMPLPLLKTLSLPPLHKVVLMGVFCLGFLTCIISGIRLTTLSASFRDPDITWTSARTVFWTLGEVACSIVCLCIPTLRPLLGTCCSPRLGEGGFMERGIRRLGCYGISLPSTAGCPSPAQTRTEAPIPINHLA
ncbi:hypothetical protein C8A01DRAFT_17288 [Parachaetomium inaequale]|uniref:Rhodopsin domain-containing protein n=1 Tax=Parachaetomium inaequale TaxID=2588326 RepID=A0AAN6PCX2_9PEZI|nr:hypothetical protein C8A01DRAFT_17288 [Parachaetomium inaequale]